MTPGSSCPRLCLAARSFWVARIATRNYCSCWALSSLAESRFAQLAVSQLALLLLLLLSLESVTHATGCHFYHLSSVHPFPRRRHLFFFVFTRLSLIILNQLSTHFFVEARAPNQTRLESIFATTSTNHTEQHSLGLRGLSDS